MLKMELGISDIMPLSVLESILSRAIEDSNIAALLINISDIVLDRASYDMLRCKIREFKKKGKLVIAYYDYSNLNNYGAISGSNVVVAHPQGALMINGISIQQLFYKGLLDKIGAKFDCIRTNTSKGLYDQYIRKDMSMETKREYNELLRDIMALKVQDIASDRGLSDAQVSSLINERGIFNGKMAKASALVNESMHNIDWLHFCRSYILKSIYGEKDNLNKKLLSPIVLIKIL